MVFLDDFSPGLLAVEAGIRADCPDTLTRVVNWRVSSVDHPPDELDTVLREFDPAIVGLSAVSVSLPIALAVARRVRAHDPRIPVVLGGLHATGFPDGIGRYGEIDYFVVGEGVRAGPMLFSALLDGSPDPAALPSLAFRRAGRVVRTPLEDLPPHLDSEPVIDWTRVERAGQEDPVWTLGDDLQLRFADRKPFPYQASQGCRHACRFCEGCGPTPLRHRSPERVAQDLAAIRDHFGVRRIAFLDDHIHADASAFASLLRVLRRLGLRSYMVVRAEELLPEQIDHMADSGVDMLYCSPESGSARVRRMMGKPINMRRLLAAVEHAAHRGMFVLSSFLLGWPGETLAEAESTLRLAAEGCFDLRLFMPLQLYANAPVGRHLGKAEIRPDTPAYFDHLANPLALCLAKYDSPTYRDLVDAGFALNRPRLDSDVGRARLAQVRIELVATRPAPRPDAASRTDAAPEVRTGTRPPKPALLRAPADRNRRVLLVSCFEVPVVGTFFVNNVSLGVLKVEAGLRARCPDVETKVLLWYAANTAEDNERFLRVLDEYRPAVVCLSSYSVFMPLTLSLAACVRRHDPRVPVILGGQHATSLPKGVARYEDIDYYVRGDGIRVGPDLVAALLDGGPAPETLRSLAFRGEGGRLVLTPFEVPPATMDEEPSIAWERLDPALLTGDLSVDRRGASLRFRDSKYFPYETGQGCHRACRFCERVGKTRIRRKRPELVVADLRRLRDHVGVRRVCFVDDTVHTERDAFVALLDALEKNLDLEYYVAIKADEMDRGLIDRMVGAGVRLIQCFPEAGSERVRALMGKPLDMPRLLDNMEYAHGRGVLIEANFIFGWPSETLDEARSTLRLARESPFPLLEFQPLKYLAAAAVAGNLARMGIEPDTPAYFRHLRHPVENCLAAYSVDEYRGIMAEAEEMEIARLLSPDVVGLLDRMGIDIVPEGKMPEHAASDRPSERPPIVVGPLARAFRVSARSVVRAASGLCASVAAVLDVLRDPRGRLRVGRIGVGADELRVDVAAAGHAGTLFFRRTSPDQPTFCRSRLMDIAYQVAPGAPEATSRVLRSLAGWSARRLDASEAAGRPIALPAGELAPVITEALVAIEAGAGRGPGCDQELVTQVEAAVAGQPCRRAAAWLTSADDVAWVCDLARACADPTGIEVVAYWTAVDLPPEGLVREMAGAGIARLDIEPSDVAPDPGWLRAVGAFLPLALRIHPDLDSGKVRDALDALAGAVPQGRRTLLLDRVPTDAGTHRKSFQTLSGTRILGIDWETHGLSAGEALDLLLDRGDP